MVVKGCCPMFGVLGWFKNGVGGIGYWYSVNNRESFVFRPGVEKSVDMLVVLRI